MYTLMNCKNICIYSGYNSKKFYKEYNKLFKDNIIYIFIGTYIQIAQRIQVHFKEYRNTKKLKVYFIIDLSIFFMITLIFI